MKTKLTVAALATLGISTLAMLAGTMSASACPNGYKRVNWQNSGNWVCMLDAAASNNLTSNPGPSWQGAQPAVPRVRRSR